MMGWENKKSWLLLLSSRRPSHMLTPCEELRLGSACRFQPDNTEKLRRTTPQVGSTLDNRTKFGLTLYWKCFQHMRCAAALFFSWMHADWRDQTRPFGWHCIISTLVLKLVEWFWKQNTWNMLPSGSRWSAERHQLISRKVSSIPFCPQGFTHHVNGNFKRRLGMNIGQQNYKTASLFPSMSLIL